MEVVFDRELEKKRAQLERSKDLFYRQEGRSVNSVLQVVDWMKRKKREKERKQWMDWYLEFNEAEGMETLWSRISGIDSGIEVKIK